MNEDRLSTGSLQDARHKVEDQIRQDPANAKHRVYLFQLLVVMGQWDRALNQLNVLEDLDPETIPMVGTYREAIRCEALREQVFAGVHTPVIFGEPSQWTAWLVEALRLTAGGDHAKAAELRTQAFEGAPATTGTVNGDGFQWLADADSRLGPVLEVIINGRYAWVPLDRIQSFELEAPVDLRDSVWMPCHFTWANGGELVGLIPTRYPGTATSDDDLLLLSRKTEWTDIGSDTYLGSGQKLMTTDAGEYALMDIRRVELNPTAADSTTTAQE